MTKEEYQSKCDEHHLKIKSLAKEYALSNNPYKIGDIVNDHTGSIKIEKILLRRKWFIAKREFEYPQCIYIGVELTKKGEPNKRGYKRSIYQSNIITN
jgi:hypothetical protein